MCICTGNLQHIKETEYTFKGGNSKPVAFFWKRVYSKKKDFAP